MAETKCKRGLQSHVMCDCEPVHPLTPREKPLGHIAYDGWAQGLPGCEWDNQTETQKRAWSKAADAILTALASGSGEHAELARLAEALRSGRFSQGDRIRVATLSEALLAEIAALRDEHVHLVEQKEGAEDALFNALSRATEAERKLAEADQVIREISETAQISRVRHLARTFLSKEAERG